MAHETDPDQPSSSSTSIHNSDDSIINRKREHRGLPSSFSSNLGCPQISPPRTHREHDRTPRSNGTSVKAIVAWIESSKKQSSSSKSGNGGSSKSTLLMSTSSPSPALQTPPDVEEYSLTLLRYRQYFTEKPLGRSLDDVWASDHLPNNTSRGGKAFSINPTSSRETRTLPKREEQNGHQIQKEQKVQGPQRHHEEASKASSDSSIANYTPLIHRDPHEVEAFWRHVQDYLWIPGEELDDDTASILSQPEARQSTGEEPSRRDSASRNDGTTQSGSSVHSPLDRQTHSRLSVSSGNPKANRRRRLLSTEEKMSEIDAFLNEGGADGLEQVSSHINSSPPERQSGNPVDVGAGEAAEPRPQRCTSCLKLKTGGSPSS